MASYRPFHPPPQSTFAPPPPPPANQNPTQPPPPPQPSRGNWGPYSGNEGSNYSQSYSQANPTSNYQLSGYGSSSAQQQHFNPPARNQLPPPPQQQPYPYQPPPPPPETSSYPPPPPPSQPAPAPPMYYSSSQYSQFNQPPPVLPPPPPPPPSSPPPPPPPSQPSSPQPVPSAVVSRESRQPNPGASIKKESKPPLPSSGRKSSGPGPSGRIETEEERRLRKRREYEKQKQEEKLKHHMRESQNKVLQKTQMLASVAKGHGSISGSHMGDRRSTPLLSSDRIENRLKKPTTFLCKLKFRNELPDPSAKMKLLSLKRDPDRYCKYQITSLEKNWKPQLYVEPDLGIPLDLLDLSVYNPPKGERIPLDPEDEELLRDDDDCVTPVKNDGIKKKERPTDKGVSWLVKTQYISPLSMDSTKQSLSEKQARELRESRDRMLLENLNSRERKIQDILASFEACKSKPVHAVNKQLQPKRIIPLFPDFDRFDDQCVVANFDSAPTADSEIYRKLDETERNEYENRAIMKSYTSGSDAEKPDKFLAYMVPSVDELEKDMYDENEDISYSWVREYHWDVRGDDVDDPTTYLVTFGEKDAKYLPLPTKLILRKKRAREGKSSEEVEHFPVPKKVTVRKRSTVAAVEIREEGDFEAPKGSNIASRSGRGGMDGSLGRRGIGQDLDADNFSGAEDDMSE